MKILLVITKAEIGGAQVFVLTLARGLKRNGFQVSVAFGDGDFLSQELDKENIPYFRLRNLKRNKNPLSMILFIYELILLINKQSFNIVHFNSTNTLPGVISARLSNCNPKTIFTVHGLSVLDKKYKAIFFKKIAIKTYFKFFLKYISNIIFVSKFNLIEQERQGITKKGSVILNGLDIKQGYFLDKDKVRDELGKLINKDISNIYLIGSIGRLSDQKNYDFLIVNWLKIKKIKNYSKLIIIGEGPEREKYEKLIVELGLSEDVFFIGEIKNASRYLKGFDLFVLPSIYEGLSISLIEALFAGIPILASNVGGNSEIIGVENCFELNNSIDFVDKLKHEYTPNTDKSEFTAENMIKRYIKIYE